MYCYVITEENDKFIEQNGRFALKCVPNVIKTCRNTTFGFILITVDS